MKKREFRLSNLGNFSIAKVTLEPGGSRDKYVKPGAKTKAIGGQTLAEAAGISLNLGDNKVESLIRQAAIHSKDAKSEPVIKSLGIRVNKVQILDEKDSKVCPERLAKSQSLA